MHFGTSNTTNHNNQYPSMYNGLTDLKIQAWAKKILLTNFEFGFISLVSHSKKSSFQGYYNINRFLCLKMYILYELCVDI